MASKLKIIPLGGVGEIGKNMTVIEYGKDIVVVDCGLIFPDEDLPGIDSVIPDMTYLENNVDKLRGFLITHGHEDHIGALPYALQKLNVPVYGTKLTLALIEHKLEEHHLNDAKLNCVNPGDTIKLGCFHIEFIKTCHSIAGAVALAITTPLGTVIHTGDFKVDFTPIDGEPMDINRFAHYGSKGVLALLSDSTNVERPGHTQSEREIGKTFEHYFDNAKGRVIVSSFASNIYRLQQIADVAIAHGRFLCFQGRSMLHISQAAMDLGYLSIPSEKIVDVERLKKLKDEQICVITTGSQGEHMSGLFRMANASHKLNIGKGDLVIISASAIPGNEKGVARVINQLFERGAMVVYDQMADVHVSGHARREELKLMLNLTKPKYFIPVHGEYRHLRMHAMLAEDMDVLEENIFVASIGDIVELTYKQGRINGSVPSGSILVDGLGVGDIGNVVLKDRKSLSQDGLVAVIVALQKKTGKLLAEPELISRGFVYMRESDDLIQEACLVVRPLAASFENKHYSEWANIKNSIRSALKEYFYNKTKRTPMILPVIVEVPQEKS
ncbi:ribonuclease J [Christensenellaceae bacterium OttesenSCG-928-L17]|nr:ribonuclease J [Christensenellaceae bacterium OttesenSCG-928-L17]